MSTASNISGKPVVAATPNDADVLTYDNASGTWISAAAGGGGGGAPQMAGNIRRQEIDDLLLATETKLGGFAFDPSLFSGSTIYLAMAAILTDAGGTAASFDLRLYDMGAPNTPQAGDLRASVGISTAGSLRRERALLTASNTPTTPGASPDDGTIYDTERLYEVRGVLTGDVGDLVELDWAGVQGG